jgi:hypothetical protein
MGVIACIVSAFVMTALIGAGIASILIGAICFTFVLLRRRDVRSGAIKH